MLPQPQLCPRSPGGVLQAHYIDYAGLKLIVATIKQAGKDGDSAAAAAASAEFLQKTEEQIKKANVHVMAELKSLQAEHKKLKAANAAALQGAPVLESPDKGEWTIGGATAQLAEAGGPVHAHVEELAELSRSLVALRRFVGTNVIAATKIVKKHDKNI